MTGVVSRVEIDPKGRSFPLLEATGDDGQTYVIDTQSAECRWASLRVGDRVVFDVPMRAFNVRRS